MLGLLECIRFICVKDEVQLLYKNSSLFISRKVHHVCAMFSVLLIVCCGAEPPSKWISSAANSWKIHYENKNKVKTMVSGAPSGSSLTSSIEVHFNDEGSSKLIRVQKSNRSKKIKMPKTWRSTCIWCSARKFTYVPRSSPLRILRKSRKKREF